ncbi:MAG: DUF3857 domain-containing protein [Chitinophagaceae bacterium]
MSRRVFMRMSMAVTIIFVVVFETNAQERPQYAISLIPDSLKKNVNSIVREESDILIVRGPGKARQAVKKVVTVLNDKAESELVFYDYYDEFRKIDDIEINIYDENGKYLKRSRKKDLHTQSAGDGFSLVTDTKVIYASLRTEKYPITIEINYDINFDGILEFPDFYPQTTEQSILYKSLSITTDSSNKVRYKNYRCATSPLITKNEKSVTYTWEVKNVQPFEKEPGSAKEDVPHVLVAPTLFSMDNYEGNMSTWDNFGKWQINLNNQTNKLKADKISFYQDLVKNAKNDREKVQLLYKYLQENFRYVSIQLGIGGWKPFTAEFVEKKKYGDCKALSNFMYAMLDAVHIKSHYAIINAEYKSMPVDKDFPHNGFNHVILCVPQPTDTIWLECTSRTQPFGRLGNFTENKNAFLITENGGVIVPTPASKAEDNWIHTSSFINLAEDGSGKLKVDITHKGEFTEWADHLIESDEAERKDQLINQAGFKQPDLLQISKKNSDGLDYTLHYDMEYEKVPDFIAGSKYFLNSRMYKFWSRALPKSEKRQNDYYMEFPLIKTDSTIYQLPEGFIVENLPKPSSIKYALGSYQSTYFFDAAKRQLITTCKVKIDKHIIPAARYQEALLFFSDIIKEQQQKVVVRKE